MPLVAAARPQQAAERQLALAQAQEGAELAAVEMEGLMLQAGVTPPRLGLLAAESPAGEEALLRAAAAFAADVLQSA